MPALGTTADKQRRRHAEKPPDAKGQRRPGPSPAVLFDEPEIIRGKDHKGERGTEAQQAHRHPSPVLEPLTDHPGGDERQCSLAQAADEREAKIEPDKVPHPGHPQAGEAQQKGDHRQHQPGTQAVERPADERQQGAANKRGDEVRQRVLTAEQAEAAQHRVDEGGHGIRLPRPRHEHAHDRHAEDHPGVVERERVPRRVLGLDWGRERSPRQESEERPGGFDFRRAVRVRFHRTSIAGDGPAAQGELRVCPISPRSSVAPPGKKGQAPRRLGASPFFQAPHPFRDRL